jgi:hypothetical protein
MWFVSSTALAVLAYLVPLWPWWLLASIVGFFVPEAISLKKQRDELPPLTHTIRHFVPNWFAFPLIYFLVGSIGAKWFGFAYPRYLAVGGLFGLLGWLTDHFTVTYGRPDPYPFSHGGAAEPEMQRQKAL